MNGSGDIGASTRDRILAAAVDLFGHARRRRGVARRDRSHRRGAQADGALLVRVEGRTGRRSARRRRRRVGDRDRRGTSCCAERSARPDRCRRAGGVPPGRAPAGAARVDSRGQPSRVGTGRASAGAASSRSSTAPSCTSAPRWMPADSATAIRGWSPHWATRRSPASPPSPRRCEPSVGNPPPPVCATSATNSEPSCAPHSPRADQVPRAQVSGNHRVPGQRLVLRRRRAWRSRARSTNRSISSL